VFLAAPHSAWGNVSCGYGVVQCPTIPYDLANKNTTYVLIIMYNFDYLVVLHVLAFTQLVDHLNLV